MDLLQVGKIINTHGLRGDVKIASWTDTPELFERLKYVYLENGDRLTVKSVRYQKNNIIVKFEEISDINEAEVYKNKVLCAERAALGELPEGVYYIADLLGCTVINDDTNEEIGILKWVLQTGSNDVYDVVRADGKRLLLPVINDVVKHVDIKNKLIRAHLIDGLEDI
jgi:16S rRNA processing protein RimM